MSPERWAQAYREAPGLFDAFAAAEDPEGRVVRRLVELAEPGGRRVLDVGVGTGRHGGPLAGVSGCYLGLEPAARMLALASARLLPAALLVQGRAEALPLREGSVDLVVGTWCLANLRPAVQAGALREAARVLRPGGGMWLVENAGDGELQELRGEAGRAETERVARLLDQGFRVADAVETELRFGSEAEARRILGYLCGESVAEALARAPRAALGHRALILHRPS